MENIIKINSNEVRNYANSLKIINERMNEILICSKNEMNSLNLIWQSKGSDTIRQKFENFSFKFQEMKEAIDDYTRFLEISADTYENIETTINNNASTFN